MVITYKTLVEVCAPRVAKGDAGMDLKAREKVVIWPQETKKVPLGITFDIPVSDAFVQITARSSVALQGCYVHVGTIDHTFNGKQVCAIVTNISDDPVKFEIGERICQAVGLTHQSFSRTLSDVDSGDSKEGFGSTGRM